MLALLKTVSVIFFLLNILAIFFIPYEYAEKKLSPKYKAFENINNKKYKNLKSLIMSTLLKADDLLLVANYESVILLVFLIECA